MKANKLFFSTLAVSLISIQSMAPADFLASTNSANKRNPASLDANASASSSSIQQSDIKIINNIVVEKQSPEQQEEMKKLKRKLVSLEKDLKSKEVLLDQNLQEIKNLKDEKNNEKIESLNKLVLEQKSDIEKLRLEIKKTEVKEIKIAEPKAEVKPAQETVTCKSESKGEKLEADVKKQLDDKEAVLNELKKENEELKSKIAKKSDKKSDEEVVKDDKKDKNTDLIALMSQMTSMFTTQMQSQMQLQIQTMTMLSQMQTNFMSQSNPYNMTDSMWGLGYDVGMPAYSNPWSSRYQDPYMGYPQMQRQPAQAPAFEGFNFSQEQVFQVPNKVELPKLTRTFEV